MDLKITAKNTWFFTNAFKIVLIKFTSATTNYLSTFVNILIFNHLLKDLIFYVPDPITVHPPISGH